MKLTCHRLKQLLHYDPKTGEWSWIASTSNCVRQGQKIKNAKNGYAFVQIDNKSYPVHRLAFLYMAGRWPYGEVDHVDQNPSNNSWSNLREATRSQNQGNSKKRIDNTSGYRGVYWYKKNNKWLVRIGSDSSKAHVGYFTNIENAALAYNFVAYERFGKFAQFNKADSR